jgi:uncharacterized protein YqeY
MSLEIKVQQAMKEAMMAKNQTALRGLRAIKSAIMLLKTEKGFTGEVTEEKELALLQKLAKQRKESYDIFTQQGRTDLAQVEKEEIEVIEKFLPEQLSEAELSEIIKEVIAQTGASSIQDMGKVMGAATTKIAGRADNKIVSQLIRSILA